MALDFSKLNFFSRLDARSRVVVLFSALIGVVFLVYLGTKLLSSSSATLGPSSVANAPQGLQSVPGGTQTAEFSKAVEQANAQRAKQAAMSGTSAIPTLMNVSQQSSDLSGCVVCTDESINVKNTMDNWVRQGKLAPDVAKTLGDLADSNAPVSVFSDQLDQLVHEGKLTPEQARQLLDQYKKQHTNALVQESAKVMDAMIKSGELPIDVANQLLAAQKRGVSTADYAAQLQALVDQKKISPEVAQKLLTQYTQQQAKEKAMQNIASLHEMARSGQITPEVEKQLVDLENKGVPVEQLAATLKQMVADGKITPAVADRILNEYKAQKGAVGPTGTLNKFVQDAEGNAYGEIGDLLKAGKMSSDVANQLTLSIQKNIAFNDFQGLINQLVQQNKLTPDIAKLKIADYKLVKCMRDESDRLGALQGNNASGSDYSNELKNAVQTGCFTPEQAAQLMQEYQASISKTPIVAPATGAANDQFAQLQQRLQQNAAATAPATTGVATPEQFVATAETPEAAQAAIADQQARIQGLMNAMSGQAQQLIGSWQPEAMVERVGTPEAKKTAQEASTSSSNPSGSAANKAGGASNPAGGRPLIKSGTIIFAVLDTAVNSDYPDSPVMATVVEGLYKGAKLLGKLTTTKSVSGQLDRISLNFTLMNMDQWDKSKPVTAYAIDPDTARTVLASDVNYHYLQRFGAIMATSFVQGYASAIQSSASTTTTGIFGTSTTHPELSPSQKLATAIGQIGTALGTVTQNYVNIPPTVKVDSGVGLGILFMSDVT